MPPRSPISPPPPVCHPLITHALSPPPVCHPLITHALSPPPVCRPLITHALSPPPAMPAALSRPYFAANPFPANINKYFGKYFSKYFGKYNVDFAAASLELEAKTGYNKLNFSVWRLLCRTITVYCPVPASCWVCLPVSPPERHPPSPWMTIWHWIWAWISKNIQPPRLI